MRSGPSCSKRRLLSELVSGQNVNYSSKYSIKFTVVFAEKKATHIFSAKILAYKSNLMIKVLTIRYLRILFVLNNWAQYV